MYAAAYEQARASDDSARRTWALWGLIARGKDAEDWCRKALVSGDEEAVVDAVSVLAWIGVPKDLLPTLRKRLRAAPKDTELADVLALALESHLDRQRQKGAGEKRASTAMPDRGSPWDRYRPITDRVGFLEVSLDGAAQALVGWRVRLYGMRKVRTHRLQAAFPDVLHRLEPLVVGAHPRELWVETKSSWTAYFECGAGGTDPWPRISYLCERVESRGLCITSVPHTIGGGGYRHGRYGSTQFDLMGPRPVSAKTRSTTIRSVVATYDSRWRFETAGEIQPFEEVTRYQARSARDRFTHEMLERYCRALGIDAFNPSFYGPNAVLVESEVVMPPEPRLMSIEETQRDRGIFPGSS